MQNQRVKEMTTLAMFIAIIAVMSFVPQLGFISLGFGLAVTLIHVPVLIGGAYGGKRMAIALGFVFGLSSFIQAFPRGGEGFNFLFQLPHISILPRVLFGIAFWGIFVTTRKLFKATILRYAVTFALATLAHSVFTLSAIALFADHHPLWSDFVLDNEIGSVIALVWTIFVSNAILEVVISTLIATPIAYRLRDFSMQGAPNQ